MKFVFMIFIAFFFSSIFIVDAREIEVLPKTVDEAKAEAGIKSEHLKTVGDLKKLNLFHYRVLLEIFKLLKGSDIEEPVKNKTVLEEMIVKAFKGSHGVCIGYRDIKDAEYKYKKYDEYQAGGVGEYDKYAKAKGDVACEVMFSQNGDGLTTNSYVAIRQENNTPPRLSLYQGSLTQENAYKIDASELNDVNEEDYIELDVAKLLAENVSL